MAVGVDVKLEEMTTHPGIYDLQLDSQGDVATEDSLDTAIFVSLFCHARATEDQILVPEMRGGWIGNERTPGYQMGSHLWLFYQERLDLETAAGLARAAEEALDWMVADGIAESVAANVTIDGPEKGILTVTIRRPDGTVESPLFELWDLTGLTWGEGVT